MDLNITKSSNISGLCKVCLKEDRNINLFKYSYNGKFLNEIFELCTQLKVEEKGQESPKHVCMICYPHLIAAFMFIQKCTKTHSLLNSVVVDDDHNYAQKSPSRISEENDTNETSGSNDNEDEQIYFFDGMNSYNRQSDITFINGEIEVDNEHSIEDFNAKELQNTEQIHILHLEDTEGDNILDKLGNQSLNAEFTVVLDVETSGNEGDTDKNSNCFRCYYCNAEFIKEIFLESHISTHHNLEKGHCPHCGKSVDNLCKYYQISENNTYTCKTCQTIMEESECIVKHLESHVTICHDSSCPHCGQHVERLYRSFLVSDNNYICRLCKRQLGKNDCLITHRMRHRKPTCSICHKTFYNRATFRKHLLIHNGIKPYAKSSKRLLKRIAQNQKRGDFKDPLTTTSQENELVDANDKRNKTKTCPICFMKLSYKSSLNAHMRTHTTSKPNYKCELCGAGFLNKGGIKDHMRKHTGEAPYICKYCCRPFRSKSSYNEHQTLHTPPGDPIECEICHKMLRSEKALKRHMIIHNKPYLCTECGKPFSFKTHLIGHQNQHKGLRPYKCKFCPNAYHQKKYLTDHELKHQKLDEIYQCYFCDKSFPFQDKLSSHLSRYHPDEIKEPTLLEKSKENSIS